MFEEEPRNGALPHCDSQLNPITDCRQTRSNPFPSCFLVRTKPLCGGRDRVGDVGSDGPHDQINCGSQGGPCDPSTQNDAGGTPTSQLLRGYGSSSAI